MKRKSMPNLRVSVELGEEKSLSGTHLFSILDNIMLYGSISRAAAITGLSYRYSWGLIRDAEETMGIKLVEKKVGGSTGGGTFLTSEGKNLLANYKGFKNEVDSQLQSFLNKQSQESDTDKKDSASASLNKQLIIASTIEPVETGLLDVLEQAFFQDTGIVLRHIALGSGRALELAKEGRADMVLTHAPELEEEFIAQGYGLKKIPVMANNYVIVGPKAIQNISPVEVFKQIAKSAVPFVSRNDLSGTHLKELEIWKAAGIEPKGDWYIETSGLMGNLGVLKMAVGKNACSIVDYATFLVSDAKDKMIIISDKDNNGVVHEELINVFSLILVNPEVISRVHFKEASIFADWIRKENAKSIISSFGVINFGEPLFSAI